MKLTCGQPREKSGNRTLTHCATIAGREKPSQNPTHILPAFIVMRPFMCSLLTNAGPHGLHAARGGRRQKPHEGSVGAKDQHQTARIKPTTLHWLHKMRMSLT
uniref:Uncharacterized protein n=1 Tax=Vitrella brassicaformis TaxID=1169539 RepID=A0A7S1NWQ1_9ALVE